MTSSAIYGSSEVGSLYKVVLCIYIRVCVPLQAQNELLWSVRDMLQRELSNNQLKEMLQFNQQNIPSGESNVSGSALSLEHWVVCVTKPRESVNAHVRVPLRSVVKGMLGDSPSVQCSEGDSPSLQCSVMSGMMFVSHVPAAARLLL